MLSTISLPSLSGPLCLELVVHVRILSINQKYIFGLVSLFNGIKTFVGNLISKPSFPIIIFLIIWISETKLFFRKERIIFYYILLNTALHNQRSMSSNFLAFHSSVSIWSRHTCLSACICFQICVEFIFHQMSKFNVLLTELKKTGVIVQVLDCSLEIRVFKFQSRYYARGVRVIVVGNEHGDMSSNPGRDWLHFK